jgi:hypothetical protein
MELRYDDLFFSNNDNKISYQSIVVKNDEYRPNPVLSNFFADFLFLSVFPSSLSPEKEEKINILYVFGNSPNQRITQPQIIYISLLAQLFPWYDFTVYSSHNLALSNNGVTNLTFSTSLLSSFTSERGRKKVLMLVTRSSSNYLEILREQESIIEQVKPDLAYVLFKLPYSNNPEGLKEVNYYDGYLIKEIWGTRENTETRLIFTPIAKRKNYNILEYEEVLAYHNQVRTQNAYNNPINEFSKFIDPTNDLRNDFDSRATIEILALYLYNIRKAAVKSTNILQLFNFITSRLETRLHNKLILSKTVTTEFPIGINDRGLMSLEFGSSIPVPIAGTAPGPGIPVVNTNIAPSLLPIPTLASLPSVASTKGRAYTRNELMGYHNDILHKILGKKKSKDTKAQLVQEILDRGILK